MAVNVRPGNARRVSSRTARSPRPRSELPRTRVFWLLAMVLLLASAVWGRLAYWQVLEHGSLAAEADLQHLTRVPLIPPRGMIYDRYGQPLAVDNTVYDVTLAPDLVPKEQRRKVADSLAAVVGTPVDQTMALLQSDRKFAYIAKRQPKEVADNLTRLQLPGVGLDSEQQRTYLPGGTADVTLGSDLLGFVDYQDRGDRGIEQYYQPQLAGKVGYDPTYRDLFGRELTLGPGGQVAPVDGSNLTLTLDSNIQFAAEQAIAGGVQASHAQSGSVIVMDPQTGGIVAYADYPSYNANQFATTDPSKTQDPMVSDLYEPGSVMKVVTLAGAINSGKITPQSVINDPGYTNVDGVRVEDWDGGANKGDITMTRVLEESYNVGAIKAEEAEGATNYLHYLRAFGLGRPSGVDIAEEANVPLRPAAQWRNTDLATAAFGQGVAVNMVQMEAALNAVVNGGRLVQPHVVEKVGGRSVPQPAAKQVISPQTAQEMNQMMRSVVQHGSGSTAMIPAFKLDEGGKTGTAEIPENGGYSTQDVWASYFGYLPAQNPRFTMLVMINRPQGSSWEQREGFYVAAPVWKQVAQQIITDWRITPEQLPPV